MIWPEFQSLSGFFRPCNFGRWDILSAVDLVSIPVGFFQALQRSGSRRESTIRGCVSIPVGFFQALQLHHLARTSCTAPSVSIPVGFFQALQHRPRLWWRSPSACFNPCRVFSGLATIGRVSGGALHQLVSIPVGFFQALQPRRSMYST